MICPNAWSLEAPEYQLKAAYLYNFIKFTDWPPGENGSFRLCILGEDPFGGDLEKLAAAKPVKERPLHVLHLRPQEDPKGCLIAFISQAERVHVPDILRKIGGRSVLTIGESPEFLEQGGMIRFLVTGNKVAFEVNLPAVQRAGLKIDARVLRMAKSKGEAP